MLPVCSAAVADRRNQLEPGRKVLRPGNDRGREVQVHGCFEPREAVLFDQIEAELAEPEPLRVVAEAAPEHRGQADIGQARGVAVSVREAEPGDAPDQQVMQVRVRDQGGREGRQEDIHRRPAVGVADRRQIDEGFDGAVSERLLERRVLLAPLRLPSGVASIRCRPASGSRGRPRRRGGCGPRYERFRPRRR